MAWTKWCGQDGTDIMLQAEWHGQFGTNKLA